MLAASCTCALGAVVDLDPLDLECVARMTVPPGVELRVPVDFVDSLNNMILRVSRVMQYDERADYK